MPTLSPEGMSRRYGIFRRSVILLFRVLFGFTVHGARRVPKTGALVIASNHRRLLDPVFVCMAVPRRVQWMAKKELFVAPLSRVFDLLGAFPVDREGGGRSALRTAMGYLKTGWALGIFPEGTRQKAENPNQAKSGAIMLALRTEALIVPVYVDRIPSPTARLKGRKWHAYIGEPIKLHNTLRGKRSYQEAASGVMEEVFALGRGGKS